MIELDHKIILDSGKVLVTEEFMSSMIVEGNAPPDHYKVLPSFDSEVYKMLYQKDLAVDDEDFQPLDIRRNQTEYDIDEVYALIMNAERFDSASDLCADRIELEISFFIEYGLTPFVLNLVNMIDRFKSDNVVWGVGRGSSCASYVLYLLEIHDIDAVKYHINFREFSKID